LLEKDGRNSPLEKGDKGGCEAQNEEENKKQPPTPPLLRGNFSTASHVLRVQRDSLVTFSLG
jgi:hypothetical protein